MKKLLSLLVAAVISYLVYGSQNSNTRTAAQGERQEATPSAGQAPNGARPRSSSQTVTRSSGSAVDSDIGFRSRARLVDHYEKHGREFGSISMDTYLSMAQALRDAPSGGSVLELVRPSDGVVSRFDKSNGAFLAFNADRTIRTYFKPNDGEAYFRRQAKRPPSP